ncbi:MAG: MBL fold metallo-hydrolase [Alphaproteobacteria bacterium]|nr:MBL fold metallo-hydrolase [Alphaproteobacteria bacterium]
MNTSARFAAVMLFVLSLLPPTVANAAQNRCLAIADAGPPVHLAALKENEVSLTFVGHSTFLIESPAGVRIATDFTGDAGPGIVPDVVTMNHAHDSHYTDFPDPKIKHVLRGWNPEATGSPEDPAAQHNLNVKDVHVRNVPTDIRHWSGAKEVFGNSIFIFEVAGLCIAHLGHLHHQLTAQHLGWIGYIDILLVPVDGTYTLNHTSMVEVIKDLRAKLVIPMHYFSSLGLKSFVDSLSGAFEIEVHKSNQITVSDTSLPQKAKILILPGY